MCLRTSRPSSSPSTRSMAVVRSPTVTAASANDARGAVRLVRCDPFYLGSVWRDASFARSVHAHLRTTRYDLVQSHERIVGLLDYGSSSEGHADQWSDIDVALFIREADLAPFEQHWKAWAAQFGQLLLAYPGAEDHPWTVYKAEPVPLRVDFAFHPAIRLDIIFEWPYSPTSIESMVLCDKMDGKLTGYVQHLVNPNIHRTRLIWPKAVRKETIRMLKMM